MTTTRRRDRRRLRNSIPVLVLALFAAAAAAAQAQTMSNDACPLGSVTVNGVQLGVPTTPLDWCLGANVSVRPNKPAYTMVGVTIRPGAGESFLSQYGRDLWKYLDIRTAVVPGTTGTIFENLFGLTYQQYSAVPAVAGNKLKGINDQAIVYFTPKDLAKVWIVTTDGTPGLSPDVPTSHGGYASAAGAVAVAGQESGGQNPGPFTFNLSSGNVQFNSPITALDPIFPMNPQYDDGSNGGFWQVSSFVTTPSVLPCFVTAGWQGTTMQDAKTAILYNPFFQAKIASFWATKKLGAVTCTTSDNTPCQPNQPSCTGNQWTQDNPKCLAGMLCKGDGIWNAPLVDCMFNILTGTDQTGIHSNGFPTSVMAQQGAYLAAVDLIQAQPPFVPTAPSSWVTDTNFNTACQSMPRFVPRACCDGGCPNGYPDQCSNLPYWPKPTGNRRTCGGQDCLTYRQTSLGSFPIPGVPSATVVVVATILAPASPTRRWQRRLPTINLNLDYTTGLCPNPAAPTITTTIQFTLNWQTGPRLLEQLRAYILEQAAQGVTVCTLDDIFISYPPLKTCKAIVEAEKAAALQQCAGGAETGAEARACRQAVQQTARDHLRACKRGFKFCRTTARDQRAQALRACKQGAGSAAFGAECRRNATSAYKQLVRSC